MQSSLTFGKVAGIPLKVHVNWFLIAALVTWSLASGYFPQQYPGWDTPTYWLVGSLTALLFFFSVLLHEMGHSLVAIRENVPVKSITLFILGGVAHISHEPTTPRAEFRIVIAGPLASFFLAGLFKLVSLITFLSPQVTGAALYLSQINTILAIFNLIPGFPLDGGRILRAILWKLRADFTLATRWACNTGLGIALIFVAGGVFLIFLGNFVSGLWVAFIGWYLSTAAQESYRQTMYSDSDALPTSPSEITRPLRTVHGRFQPTLKPGGKSFALVRVVDWPGRLPFSRRNTPAPGDRPNFPFRSD